MKNKQLRMINFLFCPLKCLFTLKHGTKMAWLIDPQEKIIMFFEPSKQPEIKKDSDLLPVISLLSDWEISVQNILDYLTLFNN